MSEHPIPTARRDGPGSFRLGIVLPPCPSPDALWTAAARADASALDSIWVTDRTIAGMPWLESLTLLGAMAARTQRVRLGTSVLVPARRNPVLVAQALATAAYLAPGRVVAGVGLGGLEPKEFATAGVALSERAALTDEHVGLLRRLWSEHAVSHRTGDSVWPEISVLPHPDPPIPIWIGGSSPGAVARAGRLGDGWLPTFIASDDYPRAWDQVMKHAVDAGREPAALTPAVYLFGAIGHTRVEAEALLGPAVSALFQAPLAHVAFTCLWGSPDDWVEGLARWAAAGVRHVNVLLFSADLAADVDLICGAVTPALASIPDPMAAP